MKSTKILKKCKYVFNGGQPEIAKRVRFWRTEGIVFWGNLIATFQLLPFSILTFDAYNLVSDFYIIGKLEPPKSDEAKCKAAKYLLQQEAKTITHQIKCNVDKFNIKYSICSYQFSNLYVARSSVHTKLNLYLEMEIPSK